MASLIKFKTARVNKAAASVMPGSLQPELPPPPELQAVLPAGPGKILQDEETFGCSTCRQSKRGCHRCSYAKSSVWIRKLEAKQEAKALLEEKQKK
eukprot:10095511-Heterocapsa_arctica.AAC.1